MIAPSRSGLVGSGPNLATSGGEATENVRTSRSRVRITTAARAPRRGGGAQALAIASPWCWHSPCDPQAARHWRAKAKTKRRRSHEEEDSRDRAVDGACRRRG